jgi:hypothetical protein
MADLKRKRNEEELKRIAEIENAFKELGKGIFYMVYAREISKLENLLELIEKSNKKLKNLNYKHE